LAQQFGVQENGAMRVNHDLTLKEIAQLIGATRESVIKVLTDFTAGGWITLDGKSVLIIGSERLVRRAADRPHGRRPLTPQAPAWVAGEHARRIFGTAVDPGCEVELRAARERLGRYVMRWRPHSNRRTGCA
jgi:hypothetical protein